MHGEGKVSLALGCQYACRAEARVVDVARVVLALPFDGVWQQREIEFLSNSFSTIHSVLHHLSYQNLDSQREEL